MIAYRRANESVGTRYQYRLQLTQLLNYHCAPDVNKATWPQNILDIMECQFERQFQLCIHERSHLFQA